MSESFSFTVNGQSVTVEADPMARLLDVLRQNLGLTGAKEGCGEGECGACSVWLDDEVVCACLVPVFQVTGRRVVTIEGLTPAQGLDPLQKAFVDEAAVQCGACTPGMIVAAKALLRKIPHPTEAEIREHLAGNLCRCTGYQAIVRAVNKAAQAQESDGASTSSGSKAP